LQACATDVDGASEGDPWVTWRTPTSPPGPGCVQKSLSNRRLQRRAECSAGAVEGMRRSREEPVEPRRGCFWAPVALPFAVRSPFLRMRLPLPVLLLVLLAVSAVPAAAQAVLYVDADAPPGGDGASWATAFHDLQDALAIVQAGDQVWVAE